jgi:hypothetical protein
VRADAEVLGSVVALDEALWLLADFVGAAGVGPSLGSGDFVGSSVCGVCVGSGAAVWVGDAVAVGTVVGSVVPLVPDVPLLAWALTTTPPVTVFVVVLLSCPDVTCVVGGSVEVCVLVVVVPVVVVVVDPLVADVSDVGEFDGLVVSSADATPYPAAIAVPTPNATASPPTRPI